MDGQHAIAIRMAHNRDLPLSLPTFQGVQQRISGKPSLLLALDRAVYQQRKATISSQVMCAAIRLGAGA